MSLKTLREFSSDSNAFELRFSRADQQADSESSLPLEQLLAWLRTCIAHGRYLPALSPEREALQALVDYWTTRLLRLGQSLPEDIERLADFDPAAGVPLTVECPYPGLEPYTDKQRNRFFGRETLIASYVTHLEDPAKRILLIIGASGSGKSSLALAGVLPRLAERHQLEWVFAPRFTPGDRPLASLASAVAQAIDQPALAPEIERRLGAAPTAALSELGALCAGRPLLLLIDQFEELFTLCRDTVEQSSFGNVVCALSDPGAAVGSFSCRMLLTLRTDHLARFETSEALTQLHARLLGEDNASYLSAIGFLEIKRAIAEPAKEVGLRFCPTELIDRLASQTAGLANGLPLLQFALRRLWETRPRSDDGDPLDLITEQSVNALPDVQRALGTVAEGIFQQFSPAQKQICERLLQELVVLDENFEEPLRRRRNEAELSAVLKTRFPDAAEEVNGVVEEFVKAGLLRRFGDGPQRQIEVAHEALLRHWEHINRLVTGERVKEQLHLVKQVGREAAEWVSRGKTEGYLNLRGERLARAQEYAEGGWLAESESTQYVEACATREKEERVKEAQTHEAKLRAEEAERAAERAGLEKAKAEKREAEAREREARVTAKKKTVQLWLGAAFAILALGGIFAWKTIADQRRQANANLNAFSTLAATLPPWEGLDVAYSLAQHADVDFRFPLAHALERMEDTWLISELRNVGLSPNQDGSALLQLDRRPGSESMRIYAIASDRTPGSTLGIVPLGKRIGSLEHAQVGPPIHDNTEDRLAVLIFRRESDRDYSVEAHHIRIGGSNRAPESSKPVVLDGARTISAINFDAQGERAVFSAYNSFKSDIYEVALNSSGAPEVVWRSDPVRGPASPVTAVSLLPGGTAAESTLITGRQDGSLYCGDTAAVDAKTSPQAATKSSSEPALPSTPQPVRQVISLPGSTTFAFIDAAADTIYAWGCSNAEKWKPQRTDGKVSGATLTWMRAAKQQLPLLAYLDENQPRCFAFNSKEKRWSYWRCNRDHRVSASVPLHDGRHLTVEPSHVAAVQIYPIEALGRRDPASQARHAGSTVVRWAFPTGAVKPSSEASAISNASDETSAAASAPDANVTSRQDLPWRSEKENEWVAKKNAPIQLATLSRDGKYLAWLEGDPPRSRIVARAWEIGSDHPKDQAPVHPGDAVSVAIANDGTLVQAQAVRQALEIQLNGVGFDTLDTRDATVCLAFSPSGEWLIAGTVPGGRARIYKVERDRATGAAKATASGPWEQPFDETTDQGARKITACDISDKGAAAIGTSDGWVKLRRIDDRKKMETAQDKGGSLWVDLTERAAFRLAAPVQDVTIDVAGQHVLALAAWQLSDCGRPGLPGQALLVWDVNPQNDNWRIPISNVCLPNQAVIGIGNLENNDRGEPGVLLVTPEDTRWHGCPGCARHDETPQAMLDRLMASAKAAKAQLLDKSTLRDRYGLKF